MTDRHSKAPDRIPLLEQFIKGYLFQAKAGSPPMNSLLPRSGFVKLQLQHSPISDSSLGIQKTLQRSTLISQEGLKFNPLMPIALNNQNLAARLWNIGMKTCLFPSGWSRPLNASSWDKPGPGTSLASPEQPRGIKEALGRGRPSCIDRAVQFTCLCSWVCHSPPKSLWAHAVPSLSISSFTKEMEIRVPAMPNVGRTRYLKDVIHAWGEVTFPS